MLAMAAAYFPESQLGNKGIEPLAFSQAVSALPIELTVPSVGWKQQHSHRQMMQANMVILSIYALLCTEQKPYLVEIALKVGFRLAALVKLWNLHEKSVAKCPAVHK